MKQTDNNQNIQSRPPKMGGGRGPRHNFEKPKDFKKSFGKLLNHTKPYLPPIILSLLFSIICTVLTIIGPSYLDKIVTHISKNLFGVIDINIIVKTCTLLLIFYVTSLILNYFAGFIMTTITNKISKNLRQDISKKINRLPLSFIDKTTHGDLLSRITNDVDTMSSSLNQSIVTVVTSSIMLICSLVIMFVKSWLLAVCAIGSSIIGFVLVTIIAKISQKHFIAHQKALGELNGHIEEVYSGHLIVKAYNAENECTETFNKINANLNKSAWKAHFLSGLMMPIMDFIGNLGYVVVCVVGSALVINGSIEIGTIAAFMLYIRYFTQPLTQIAQVAASLQSAVAAGERVFDILEQPELDDESHKTLTLTNCKGNVEFNNVNFGYTSEKRVIKDFSATIKAGQKVAIVGPTGAGKTTLVNLLMRFYEINSGTIEIDGINIKNLTRENIHNLFSMVLQDTWIFNGTVKENIVYNQENVSDEKIKEVCKAVGLHHLIKTLPEGYNTVLDENTTISAGQKQLLTIARAMIQNSPMLILDEATSSVDTRLEILIQEAMDKLMKNRTSFVIAHRLSTIKNADLILVIKDGDVIECGTHNELILAEGFYAELYNSQFEEV